MASPRCFISYSWDSDFHKGWVRSLAEQLQANGVEVLLDQWDVRPGMDLPAYMETSVREADYVLLICTPVFAQKANAGRGGVGYEKMIVTGEIFTRIPNAGKFIPLLASGSPDESLPSYLKARVFLDFRTPTGDAFNLEELLRHIFDKPRFVRPPRGTRPAFSASGAASADVQTSVADRYCRRCGAVPGNSTKCTGGYSHHDFVRGNGSFYCRRCGAVPGAPSTCTGGYSHHDFVASTGRAYCRRCGANTGKSSMCTGGYSHHDFVPWTDPVYCRRCGALPGTPTKCTGGYSHHDFVPN
jgi:TIR domain